MKKVFVLMVAITLVLTSAVSAKITSVNAEKLPVEIRQEITKNIDYPKFAKDNMVEGTVWMKVMLDENSDFKIVELSSTNPELGEYVKTELANISVKNTSIQSGNIYVMKVKFDLKNL